MFRARNRLRLSVLPSSSRQPSAPPDAPILDDQARSQSAILKAKEIFLRANRSIFCRTCSVFAICSARGVIRRLSERHILLAAAIDQKATLDAQFLWLDPMSFAGRGDAFLQLMHIRWMPRARIARS